MGTDEWRRLTVGSTPPPDFERTGPGELRRFSSTQLERRVLLRSDADAPCTAGKPDQLMRVTDPHPCCLTMSCSSCCRCSTSTPNAALGPLHVVSMR